MLFIDAFLAPRMIELGMTEADAGLGFSLHSFFYALGAFVTGHLC